MNVKKFIGWVLFILGLIIILWSLYASYNIFSAKKKAPEIFKIEKKETPLSGELSPQAKTSFSSPDIEEEIRKIIEVQMKEIIPSEFLSQILNLISWSIFVGILILGGSKIASIGIRLIKEE